MSAAPIPLKPAPSRLSTLWMLYFMLLVAVPLAVIANWRQQVFREQAAARRLVDLGGSTSDRYYSKSHKLSFLLPANCRHPITSYSSQYIGKLASLREPVPVTNETIGLLAKLPNLRILRLSGEKQPTVNFAPLKALAQLEHLELWCGVNDDNVLAFLSQRHLEELDLRGQPISDKSLLLVAKNPQLERLYLNKTAITDSGMKHLSALSKLEFLELSNTGITSAGLSHLTALQNLQHLDLSHTAIDDTAIPHLVKLQSLVWLHCEGTKITEAGRERIQREIPGCGVLRGP